MLLNYIDYITFLLMLLCNSLFIFGIYRITQYEEEEKDVLIHDIDYDELTYEKRIIITDKMAFWWFRKWCIDTLGVFWSKPLCLCPPCMASVYGSIFFFLIMPCTLQNIIIWPFYIISLAGINYGIQKNFE